MKKNLSMIFQSESVECGLATLAMILDFHGMSLTLSEMRQAETLSLSGLSVATLVKIAAQYKLNCKVLRLEVPQMTSLILPAILHWNLNHFVVLKKITPHYFILHDPSRGVLKVPLEDFSQSFSGIAIECQKGSGFQEKKPIRQTFLKEWLRKIPGVRGLFLKLAMFSVVYQIFLLWMPHYLQIVVDKVIPSQQFSLLFVFAAGFLALRLWLVATNIFKTCCIHKMEHALSFYLGADICGHIFSLPLSFFEKRYLGDMLNRFNSIEQLRQIISSGLMEGLLSGLLVIAIIFVMGKISLLLASVSVFLAALYFFSKRILQRKQKIKTAELLTAKASEQVCFMENIRGIQPIKIFLKETDRFGLWKNKYQLFLRAAYQNNFLKASGEYIKELLVGLELAAVIFLGAFQVMHHQLSIGFFYTYLFYRQQFSDAVILLSDKINDFKMLTLYRERLNDFVQTKSQPTLKEKIPENFSIKVEALSFRYSSVEPWVFSNIHFEIKEKEIVALIGPSGAGKTTLLKILMGLLSASSGTIQIGDCELSETPKNIFASVMQEDCLLSGSIAENIAFFSKEPNIEKIYDAAQKAGIYQDIINMPMKFSTLVGDMGTTLSGGQKQRVLLARAFYAQPKILFLDEATSHLDLANEKIINQTLKHLKITTLMIAHREETIRMADRVISMSSFI